jgi:hypothetical protein
MTRVYSTRPSKFKLKHYLKPRKLCNDLSPSSARRRIASGRDRSPSSFFRQPSTTGPVVPLLCSTQIAGACLRASPHHAAITRSHTVSYPLSIFVVGGSLRTIVNVLTYVLYWGHRSSRPKRMRRSEPQRPTIHACKFSTRAPLAQQRFRLAPEAQLLIYAFDRI